ncbi:DUF2207 domain-containing protein [Shumkonia mesophila]|uniref:DUF2207 domain-containing protein n=1 Tax=Shumkonia mesophila TaxID=2838854 RepID=UPI002934BF1A|nr:DUF2207 domain-containing protein [Shumkonia mesophila]
MTGRLAFLGLLANLLLGLAAVRTAAAEEAILDYKSRIVVNADATLTVTETLHVRAEGNAVKRGIFRAFPTLYRDRLGRDVRVTFDVLDVQRDGRPEPHRLEAASNGSILYIGQPDVLLQPGKHTYTLEYRTDRQIGYFADYDEIYWNVTGSDWTLPRQRIEAVVVLPYGAPVLRHAAYTGRTGQHGEDYAVDRDANDDIRFTTTRVFGPGEDLTIAVAWQKGYVAEPSAAGRVWGTATDNAGAIAGTFGLLLVLAAHVVMWRRVGRDPRRGPIVRVSQPPKGLSPAVVRYIMRGEFDDKAFAAAIVDMAVKGALSIEAGDDTFTVRRTGEGGADLSPGEKKIAAALFGGSRAEVEIGKTYQPAVGAARAALERTLKAEYRRAFFSSNRTCLLPGAALSALTLAAMILAAPSPADAGGVMVFCILALGVLAFFGYRGLGRWKAAFARRGRGGRPIAPAVFGVILLATVVGMAAFVGKAALEVIAPTTFVLLVLVVLVNALFFHLMSAPTVAGRRIMDAVEGFGMYLSAAGQLRQDAQNPPAMTSAMFEKYLPYALALDVETAWGERFAAALGVAKPGQETFQPAWYSGQPGEQGDSHSFPAAMGGGLVGAVSASATAPGSTAGGGGSGGGGSAGGGGGGGGGGGW